MRIERVYYISLSGAIVKSLILFLVALNTALATAGGKPIMAISPIPFETIGFKIGSGLFTKSTLIFGTSVCTGTL